VQNISLVDEDILDSKRTWYPIKDPCCPILFLLSPISSETREAIEIAEIRLGWVHIMLHVLIC